MAAEPIVIYSHKIDPAGVLQTLRKLAPDLRVEGPENDWKTITIFGPKPLLRKATSLSFGHDLAYYAGTHWDKQIRGMQGYFSRFPENQNTARIMLLIQSFKFSIATFPVPEPELYLDSDDPRLGFVFAVVKHLDGVIFTPSSLRDSSGRILYDSTGDPDPKAVMPAIYKAVEAAPRSQRTRSEHGTLPDPDAPPPPSPDRVAHRACALAAVTARALLEQEDASDPGVEQTRARILTWVNEIGIRDELEPDEWKVLQLPLGVPPQRDIINATWRLEGLGVLAWALGRFELRPHDQLADPVQLLPSLGILNAQRARELIASPALRPIEELQALSERLFAIHWRLREWHLKHRPMDFPEFARNAWFGPLDLANLPLIENDLAIDSKPLSRALEDAVSRASSAAVERRVAANWLMGGSAVYSQTDTST